MGKHDEPCLLIQELLTRIRAAMQQPIVDQSEVDSLGVVDYQMTEQDHRNHALLQEYERLLITKLHTFPEHHKEITVSYVPLTDQRAILDQFS